MFSWIQSHLIYVLGGVATVGVLFGDKIVSGLLALKSTGTKSTGAVSATQAFAAVETLANYKAKSTDDPAYKGVMAAVKAQLE